VVLIYRIERLTGTLSAAFSGLPGPGCELLDACGLSATWSYGVDVKGGAVKLGGDLPATPRRFTTATALRAVRAGRITLEGEFQLPDDARGETTLRESRDDGSLCRDTVRTDAPAVQVSGQSNASVFHLGWRNADPELDPLRARCPGPSYIDVLHNGDAAVGAVRAGDLTRRDVVVELSGAAPFAGGGYAGNREGAMSIRLRRLNVIVFPGERP
jgi:hypothetical protein